MRGFLWFILIVVALLSVPVKIFLLADGVVSVSFGWLFFRYTPKVDKAETKPRKKAAKKPRKAKKTAAKPKRQYSYEDILLYVAAAREVVRRMYAPLRRTLRRIKLTNFELELHIAGADAADCATRFGQANILVYNAITLLESIVTLRIARIGIYPAFDREQDGYHIRAIVRLVPLFLLGAALNIAYILLTQYYQITKHSPKSAKEEQQYGTTTSRQ